MGLLGRKKDKTAEAVDKELTESIRESFREQTQTMKLLLLGAGESGKSTIFKQMRILYGDPPTEEENALYTACVHNNILSSMRMIIDQAIEWGKAEDIMDQHAVGMVQEVPEGMAINPDIGLAIKVLWRDAAFQKVWARRSEYQAIDTLAWYLEEIDRISAPNYVATQQDYLRARVRTTNVVTSTYVINGTKFEWYDVGGQRNQRRKWIHCFSDVTAVIFVAALSEYNQTLYEDTSVNRMAESLDLFQDISQLEHFEDSSLIVFLNKYDLFQKKIFSHPIDQETLWNDFTGGTNRDAALEYFKQKFNSIAKGAGKSAYFHVTTATDTNNVSFVVGACQDIILHKNIERSGLC